MTKRLLLIGCDPDVYVLAMRAARKLADSAGEKPVTRRNAVIVEYEDGTTFAAWQTATQRTVRRITHSP